MSDDGAGLDTVRIHNRAIENGLVEKSQDLSDDEIYELIFAPGFSTARAVTEVSGRGVGLDVVRRNILALGGHVKVDSAARAGH